MRKLMRDLGFLRCLLLAAVLLSVAAAPFADGSERLYGWALVPTVIGPTVMMIVLFVLPLDMIMARVFMEDTDAAGRRRLKRVIVCEAVALLVLVAAWLPFMLEVLDFNPFA